MEVFAVEKSTSTYVARYSIAFAGGLEEGGNAVAPARSFLA